MGGGEGWGGSEKLKKGGESMMQGQVFLKRGELAHFIFNFVQGLLFLHLEIPLQSHYQLQDTANIIWHQQFTSADISSQSLVRTAAGDDFVICRNTGGQVFVLPSRSLMHSAADDNFIKLLYSFQNCVMHLKKTYFFLPP